MKRAILGLFLLAGTLACGSPQVRFSAVSPLAPIFNRPGWVAIVRPEGVEDDYARIESGAGMFGGRMKVYWAGALDAQAQARFKPCFEGGAILMEEGEAAELERIIQAARSEGASPGSDPRSWREAVGRATSASPIDAKDPAARRASDNALSPPALVIRFTDPEFFIEDRRPVFRSTVTATEPLTTRLVINRPYSTQGRTLKRRSDEGAFARDVHEAVSEAIGGAVTQLARDIDAELAD